jgi:hypothetical protein
LAVRRVCSISVYLRLSAADSDFRFSIGVHRRRKKQGERMKAEVFIELYPRLSAFICGYIVTRF